MIGQRKRSGRQIGATLAIDSDRALLTRLTAVVLNWGRPDLTIRCVRSLIADGVPEGRVVVVDNGSLDDSYEQFCEVLSGCALVRLPTNVGIGRALNRGALELPGDDYLLLNNDAFVHDPGSVARLVQAMRRNHIGVAVPRLLNDDLTLQPNIVAPMTPRTAFVGAIGLSRLIPNRWQPYWSTHWDHGESRAVICASGAVFAVRGEVWRQLGGITEERWMYGEDIDLCRRATALGWKIWFERDATFVHLGSSTVSGHWTDATRASMIAQSEIVMLDKQLPKYSARLTVLFLFLGAGARWIVFSVSGAKERAGVFRSVMKVHLAAARSREGFGSEPGAGE
jgi:N-acetylglucosaminyl-diphospho-decaprenol L-rhamnosyltransferase